MKKISALLLLFMPLLAHAQLPSGSDIWLFDLNVVHGNVSISGGENITKDNAGYDNQPAFAPSGEYLLFSSERGGRQTDIYKYTMRTKKTEPLVQTPATSEFSPTFVPGQKYVSTVMVEKDSTQRIWRTLLSGEKQEVVYPKLDSVGYHCWFDEKKVFAFVLTQPFTLQLIDNRMPHAKVVATNVGRSMQLYTSPVRKMLLYTHSTDSAHYTIEALNSEGLACRDFTPVTALEGSQDFVVTKSGVLLMAKGAKIYSFRIGKDTAWKEVADLSASGLKNITRLAISKNEGRIALVDNPAH